MTISTETQAKKVAFIVEPIESDTKNAKIEEMLNEGLKQYGISMSPDVQKKIYEYIDLLIKWNRAYNLTSVRDPAEIMTRHILDSLSVGPHLHGHYIIDVGTGAGLPGIPLALAYPDKDFTLLDSNGKKTRFLFHVVQQLKLMNVHVVNERVEGYQKIHDLKVASRFKRFDTIISRAYSSLREMLYNTEHLCTSDGVFIAMKGVYPLTELHEIPAGFKLSEVAKVEVPYLNAERHLVKAVIE